MGFISKFLPKEDTITVTEAAATASEAAGRYDDTIMLYDLAGRPDKVLQVRDLLKVIYKVTKID